MKTEDTTKQTQTDDFDWAALDAMTEEEVHAAALADPDAQPMTEEDFARMEMVPRTKTLRRALGLSQEEFAARYHIPVGTLRDWEQSRSKPDKAASAYLHVIAKDPEGISNLLAQ